MPPDDNKLRSHALDAVRNGMSLDQWDRYAELIVADRNSREIALKKQNPDTSWEHLVSPLRENGFVKLPNTLQPFVVDDIVSHLKGYPVHKGPHVFSFDGRLKSFDRARSDYSMVGYRSEHCICTPHVVDIFNDPRLVDLLEAYLGCVPTLYSLNAWWSFPASKPELVYSQYFHRDIDDWRFVTLFLYLTDVNEQGGPHQLIPNSHTRAGMEKLLSRARAAGRASNGFDLDRSFVSTLGEDYAHEVERLLGDMAFNIVGPAGTMHLVNTIALHRGLTPINSPRLVMWARYGLGPTINSSDLEHGPLSRRLVPTAVQDTPRNRYVNRLLFDFERGPDRY